MATLTLRKVGGSVVATFPKTLLDLLNVKAGDCVEYMFTNGKMIIASKPKVEKKQKKYDLSQLLEEQKLIQEEVDKDRGWVHAKPVGSEKL